MQWGLRVPLDQIVAVHIPNGVALPAIATKNSVESMLTKGSYYFKNRPGVLSFHEWRNRFYVIETKQGGLLIYCDDPTLEHRPALEFDHSKEGVMVISNRSIMNPPWQKSYTGTKWVIHQFKGSVGIGVQYYQDWLVKAMDVKPLKDRPTAWVRDLAYCDTKPGIQKALPMLDHPEIANYVDGWQESIDQHIDFLKNMAKFIDPKKTMLYDTGWNTGGLSIQYPDHSIDAMFGFTIGPARKMGYHFMVHMNAKFFYEPSIALQQYIMHQWKQLGLEGHPGVIFDALQNHEHYREGYEANDYQKSIGIDPPMTRYAFNPAYEPFRYVLVSSVLSAVRATGADMVHFDVPSIPLELHNDRYGMNIAQGMSLLFKQIREALDANGFEHVAIASEITPMDGIFKYVDMGQNSHDESVVRLLKGRPSYELKELQMGEAIKRQLIRRGDQQVEDGFDVEYYRAYVKRMDSLSMPSVDAMLRAGYVQAYPHLGVIGPDHNSIRIKGDNAATFELAAQALPIWVTLTNQAILHDRMQYPAFMDDPALNEGPWLELERKRMMTDFHREEGKLLTSFNYGKFALVKLWEDLDPNPAAPGTWERGDLSRFTTSKGDLIVTRSGPTTLKIAFEDGQTVAELDVFNGWQNAAWLMDHYALKGLKDQIDPIDLSADQVGTLLN